MINWKIRFKNPVFYMQLILAVLTPVLAYMGLTVKDLTTRGRRSETCFCRLFQIRMCLCWFW